MLPTNDARLTTSPSEALNEKERRLKARRNFLSFCHYVDPLFESPAHIQLTAAKLQKVALYIQSKGTKGIGRLMIMMPPRHGKSELASKKFPGWLLGVMPDKRVIMTSYAADLAVTHSRAVRNLLMDNKYQALFGDHSSMEHAVELSSDSRSVSSWDLAQPHRGGMVATGVGGGVTGLGADLLILDDLFKNREEADSENRRELVDDWYRSSAYTRLMPHAAIILFFTRWHPDDQAGRLIRRMVTDPNADQWDIIFLPGLALDDYSKDEAEQLAKMREGVYLPLRDPLGRKPGQALWPEHFDEAFMRSKLANIDRYEFEALYQQMPYLREGGFFKRNWFTVVPNGPGRNAIARVRSWDKAATSGGGAATAGVLMSRGRDGFTYVEHVAGGHWSSYERDQQMTEIGKEDYTTYGQFLITTPQDPGSGGLDSARATTALMAEAGLFTHFEPVSGDKEVRAGPYSSAAQAGKIRLVQGAWNEPYLDELAAFPKGRRKDMVDGSSDAYNTLRELVEALNVPEDQMIYYEERVNISPV